MDLLILLFSVVAVVKGLPVVDKGQLYWHCCHGNVFFLLSWKINMFVSYRRVCDNGGQDLWGDGGLLYFRGGLHG